MELNFTDALISTDMIGAMIGVTEGSGKTTNKGMYMHTTEITTGASASATMDYDYSTTSKKAHYAPAWGYGPSYAGDSSKMVVYVKERDTVDAEWEVAYIVKSTTEGHGDITKTGTSTTWKANTSYCVKLFVVGDSASTDTIFNLNADFVPSVLHAITYVDVYEAGVAGCSGGTGTSTGTAVGQLVIDIPLFQLNNGLNLQLS